VSDSASSGIAVPAVGPRTGPGAAGTPDVSARIFRTDARRWLQLGLAAIWVADGLLQSQPFMFSRGFATDILAPNARDNPAWLSESILWAARSVESTPVWANSAFVVIQLLIGLGIASRRTVKPALAVSLLWALLLWWFGEAFGGLLVPGASALGGAPGAAVLYAILAVLLWPRDSPKPAAFVASGLIGARAATLLWLLLWGGLAALNLAPTNLEAGSTHRITATAGVGQPVWLDAAINGFSVFSERNGLGLAVIGALVLSAVAIGMVLPARVRRAAVIAAVVVSMFIWFFGEALGAVFGGEMTDVDSGPLLALIALAYWPAGEGTA
jgi:hypothetical protein